MENSRRYSRGEQSPLHPNKVFLRYNRGKEVWVSPEFLQAARTQSRKIDAKWKTSDSGRSYHRKYHSQYGKQPEVKEKRSAYYKRPDVRQRIRDKHNSKPEVIARREARLKRMAERAAYRKSDEFRAILKVKNHEKWLKRKAAGKSREYDRNRWKSNLQHRLGQNMRRLVHSALTRTIGVVKSARTFQLIGCSPRALSVHLEAQFTADMSWENYGTFWEVDHITPLALFDLRDPKQQNQAFYFENLQPLEVPENRRKSDKIDVDGKQVSVRKIVPFKAA